MGLHLETLQFVHQALLAGNIRGGRMCELGNQQIRPSAHPLTTVSTGKDYFTMLGFEHVSLDLNGLDGAQSVDLSLDIVDPALVGTFDVLTDCGTVEHVRDQYRVFQNIYRLVRPGGLMIHVSPARGSWPRHGRYHYTLEFFSHLATACHYEMLLAHDFSAAANGPQSAFAAVALRRTVASFMPRAPFEEYLAHANSA